MSVILLGSALGVTVRIVVGVVLAVVITSVSLRLLGMRRGWGTALLAGVLGWGVALVVALGVSRWDWGADGLALHVVAIGVPATMTAAVALDLLARPGSLAIGERAGLVVTPPPDPRRPAADRRLPSLPRARRPRPAGGLRAARGPAAPVDVDSQAVRLRRVLEGAGGVYVKLGQIAATRVDLLPADVCAELATLQNRVPPEPREGIAAVLAGRARRHRRDLRRVRVGAARRGVDRADPPGGAAHGRGRRRQGPASGHRGDDGAGPRRARPARRPGPAAHAVRSGRALRRDAGPVRRGAAGRARLPSRGRRDDRDGGPARR